MIVITLIIAVFVAFVILFLGETTTTKNETTLNMKTTSNTPVDCIGNWSAEWSPCTQTCGGGIKTKTFTILKEADGGVGCKNQMGDQIFQPCNEEPCPVDCIGNWSAEWSPCSRTCGGGIKTKTFTITTPAEFEGAVECDNRTGDQITEACNTDPCGVDCEGEWSAEWSSCTETCGGGIKTKTFTILKEADFGGVGCDNQTGDQIFLPCNEESCPIDCVGSWSTEWSQCSKTCGGGERTKTFTITTPAAHSGVGCEKQTGDQMTEPCNTDPCPIDCVGEWTPWTPECPTECNASQVQSRTFEIKVPAEHGGEECEKYDGYIENRPCKINYCQSYYPYRMKEVMMAHYFNDKASQYVTKEECEQTCFDSTWCKSYTYCNNFPGINARRVFGPDGADVVGPCLHFDKSKEHLEFLGFAPTMRELLRMTPTEFEAIQEPINSGCGLWEMHKPGNDADIDCVGEWIQMNECDQPCDGTQTPNSGRQRYKFEISQWRENGGLSCETVHGQEKDVPCDVGCPAPPPPPIQVPQDIEFLVSNLEFVSGWGMNQVSINSYLPISDYPTGDITDIVDLGYGQTNRDGTGQVDIDGNGYKFLRPTSHIAQSIPFVFNNSYYTYVMVFKPSTRHEDVIMINNDTNKPFLKTINYGSSNRRIRVLDTIDLYTPNIFNADLCILIVSSSRNPSITMAKCIYYDKVENVTQEVLVPSRSGFIQSSNVTLADGNYYFNGVYKNDAMIYEFLILNDTSCVYQGGYNFAERNLVRIEFLFKSKYNIL